MLSGRFSKFSKANLNQGLNNDNERNDLALLSVVILVHAFFLVNRKTALLVAVAASGSARGTSTSPAVVDPVAIGSHSVNFIRRWYIAQPSLNS